MKELHVALFDLYTGGHHAHHLYRLAEYWVRLGVQGQLSLIIPATYREKHSEIMRLAAANECLSVIFVEQPVAVAQPRRFSLLRNSLDHGRIAREYLERLRPQQCVFMFFDHVQLPLALGLRFNFPIALSGLFFRPSLHYRYFPCDDAGIAERITRWRKRIVLRAAMRNPHLTHLFSFDAFAVPYIQALGAETKVIATPDGVEKEECEGPLARSRRVGERMTFFSFGALDERKGMAQVLEAAYLLPPDIQQRVCLRFVGRVAPAYRAHVHALARQVQLSTQVEVDIDDRFVDDAEIQPLIHASDVVLVTYQRHVGTSGLLVRAAMGERPVIGSHYGVVGEQIRRYGLGLALDATSPREIARAITEVIRAGCVPGFDSAGAQRFAGENTMRGFATTLFRSIGALS